MTKAEISALLENKFQGVRKDSLQHLAAMLTMMDDEAVKKFVDGLDVTRLNEYVSEDRKSRDSEITKSNQTLESNLRAKFDFVEKKQPSPEPQPEPQPTNATDIAALISKAVADAVKPMAEQIQTLKSERDTTARLGALNQFLNEKNLPESYKELVRSSFSAQSFADENAFNAFLETQKSSAAKFEQELIDQGFAGGKPLAPRVTSEGISSGVALYLKNAQGDEFKGKEL